MLPPRDLVAKVIRFQRKRLAIKARHLAPLDPSRHPTHDQIMMLVRHCLIIRWAWAHLQLKPSDAYHYMRRPQNNHLKPIHTAAIRALKPSPVFRNLQCETNLH